MSVINKVQVLDTVTKQAVVVDVGAKAENIEFDNGSNLEDKFVNFAGASSETAGTSGLVPAPAIADRAKFLDYISALHSASYPFNAISMVFPAIISSTSCFNPSTLRFIYSNNSFFFPVLVQ